MGEWKVDINKGRHSFPFVYGIRLRGERTRPNDLFGIQGQQCQKWCCLNRDQLSISLSARGEHRLTKLYELCWQITSGILSMNAHGQTPLALTLATAEIQIGVHLSSSHRLVLLCLCNHWRWFCHFSGIKPLTGSCMVSYYPCRFTEYFYFVYKSFSKT